MTKDFTTGVLLLALCGMPATLNAQPAEPPPEETPSPEAEEPAEPEVAAPEIDTPAEVVEPAPVPVEQPPETTPEPVAAAATTSEPAPPPVEEVVAPEEPSPIQWTLSARLRPRTEFRYNNLFNLDPASARYNRTDNGDALSTQSRLGVGLKAPEVEAQILLQHAAAWGAAGGDRLTDPGLGIHIASLSWIPNDWWWLQVGRFEIAYGDERLLGSVGWSQIGRAWDGARTGFVFADKVGLDAFGAVYQEGSLQPASGFEGRVLEDDALLTGLYFHGEELSEFVGAVDVYAIGDMRFDTLASSPQRQTLGTFGARFKGIVEPAELTVEGAYQAGERCVEVAPADPRAPATLDCTDETVAVSAGFFDTEFSLKAGKFKPFAGFGMATGNDPDTEKNEGFSHLYPTAHKFLGLSDIVGARTNVREIRAGTAAKFGKFTFRESLHYFSALQPTQVGVGFEADTVLGYQLNDFLTAQAGHAVFVPFDGVSTDGSDPSGVANWWFLQLILSGSVGL